MLSHMILNRFPPSEGCYLHVQLSEEVDGSFQAWMWVRHPAGGAMYLDGVLSGIHADEPAAIGCAQELASASGYDLEHVIVEWRAAA